MAMTPDIKAGAGAVSLATGWRASSGAGELVELAQLGAITGVAWLRIPRWRYPGRPSIRRR